jgi:hypothetical protein
MKTQKSLVVSKTLVARALMAAGLATAAIGAAPALAQVSPLIASPINLPNGSPNDGMACRSSPNAYTGSQSSNTFFCKRTKIVNQALTCSDPRFPTKVVRVDNAAEPLATRGKDVCLAPGRFLASNDLTTGLTLNQDFVFVSIGATQVSTVVANQRQAEATATGLALNLVDAKSIASSVNVNAGSGGIDLMNATIEFATFPNPVGLSILGAR